MLIKKYVKGLLKNENGNFYTMLIQNVLLNQCLFSPNNNQLLFLYFQVFITYSKTTTSEAGPREKVKSKTQPTRNAFLHTITVVKFYYAFTENA